MILSANPANTIHHVGFTATIKHGDTPPTIDVTVDLRGDVTFDTAVPIIRDFLSAHLQLHLLQPAIRQMEVQLNAAAIDLQDALTTSSDADPLRSFTFQEESLLMATAPDILASLSVAVARSTTVMTSAGELIRGIAARVDAAITKALANGATAEQLAPIIDEALALSAGADALAADVAANTVAAPEVPPVA